MLVSPGVELIFFTVASTGLWFGFVLNRELTTERCFCYPVLSRIYTDPKPFLLFAVPCQWRSLGTWGWEKTQLWWVTPTDQRDIPDLMTSYSVYKVWEEKGDRENAWNDAVSLSKSLLHMMGPRFPGDGWTPACPWEAVNWFLVLLCLCKWLLFSLFNSFYLNPWAF